MLLAHLSDLHLRDDDDAIEFDRQLDRIVARRADHLVITGDLLDRWHPALLDRVLDALAAHGLLSAQALTILHGNHDFASSGGHPRQRSDLWRLALRFWDPPPLVMLRKRRFHRRIEARAPGAGPPPPFLKPLANGFAIAALNTVPAPWLPLSVRGREVRLNHARGRIGVHQTDWLERLPGAATLVVLTHHYPLEVAPYRWRNGDSPPDTTAGRTRWLDRWTVVVPMEITGKDRERFWSAASAAGVAAVLCGHVHRARVETHRGIAVGLNGQSGADWAGRTIAYYRFEAGTMRAEYESLTNERV